MLTDQWFSEKEPLPRIDEGWRGRLLVSRICHGNALPCPYVRKPYKRDVSGSADYSLTLEGGIHADSQPNNMFRARLTDRTPWQTGSRRTDVSSHEAGVDAFGCPVDSGARPGSSLSSPRSACATRNPTS